MANAHGLFSRVYRRSQNKQIKVLGIMASPRRGGNSDILLEAALRAAEKNGAQTEKIIVNDLKIIPCQACDDVLDDGRCKIQDDFQKIYETILSADSVLVASPIYFGSITAQLKILIDRFQCHWRAKYLSNTIESIAIKQGGFICVQASSKNDFFENAGSIIKNFFTTAGIEYCLEIFCSKLGKKGSVRGFPEYIEKTGVMGEKLAQVK